MWKGSDGRRDDDDDEIDRKDRKSTIPYVARDRDDSVYARMHPREYGVAEYPHDTTSFSRCILNPADHEKREKREKQDERCVLPHDDAAMQPHVQM